MGVQVRLPDAHASDHGGQNHPLGDCNPDRPVGECTVGRGGHGLGRVNPVTEGQAGTTDRERDFGWGTACGGPSVCPAARAVGLRSLLLEKR